MLRLIIKRSRLGAKGLAINVLVTILCLYVMLVIWSIVQDHSIVDEPSLNTMVDDNHMSNNKTIETSAFRRRLPQAIIIGARKCGTRALLKFLTINPSIRAAQEEIHFFDEHYSYGLEWYRSRMPPTLSGQVTMEKSPAYFVMPSVPERVHAMNANVKLILILRDPVNRLISDYSQSIVNRAMHGKQDRIVRFEKYVLSRDQTRINEKLKAVKIGMYAMYLERWRTYFDLADIHIVDGEQLIENPYEEMRKVEHFLSVPPYIRPDHFVYNSTKGFYCVRFNSTLDKHIKGKQSLLHHFHCLNDSKGRKHQLVAQDTLRELGKLYAPWNEYLYSLIGRKFNWSGDLH